MRPRREEYGHLLEIQTRWNDNDVYGHVNNVDYHGYFDTVINRWLISQGGLDINEGRVVGFCVESGCSYFAPIGFPEAIEAGLRVGKLGRSSVRYEIGIFKGSVEEAVALGHFVHVFVDRDSDRSVPIPPRIRSCLKQLLGSEEEAVR